MTEEVKPSETGDESATKEENTSEKPEQTIEEKLEEVKITEDKKEKVEFAPLVRILALQDENDNKEDPQVENTQIEKEHNKEENGDEDEGLIVLPSIFILLQRVRNWMMMRLRRTLPTYRKKVSLSLFFIN